MPMLLKDFVKNYCDACGGDWVGMLLSGLKKVRPDLWDALPEDEPIGFEWLIEYLAQNGVIESQISHWLRA